MDVSVNPVLESVRPFFQGLPANTSSAAAPATSVGTSLPSHPAVATPVQPTPPSSIPSSSPSVLSYWPGQRGKEQSPSVKSPALASQSPLHHVYNGTKLGEETQRLQHNLPPIAALSSSLGYQHSLSHSRGPPVSQGAHLQRTQQHLLPSITQLATHSTAKTPTSSVSPRTAQSQFRAPDYPQSNHHSIYSPNSSNQSHSRSSSSSSSYQSQMLVSKYQSSPSSPAASSSSPHQYNYSPRTSLPLSAATTASSPVYPQTTSTTSVYVSSSHHQQQQLHPAHLQQPPQQTRPPSNQHQSHHPMSPVIQQPSQPELHAPLKIQHSSHGMQQAHPQHTSHQQQPLHHQTSTIQQTPAHQQPSNHQQPTHLQQSSSSLHHAQQPNSHAQPSQHQQSNSHLQSSHFQQPSTQQLTHLQQPSSHHQPSPPQQSSNHHQVQHPQQPSNHHQLTLHQQSISHHQQSHPLQTSSQRQQPTHSQQQQLGHQQSQLQHLAQPHQHQTHPLHSSQQSMYQQHSSNQQQHPPQSQQAHLVQNHQQQLHQSYQSLKHQQPTGVQQLLHQQSMQPQSHPAQQQLKSESSHQGQSHSAQQRTQQYALSQQQQMQQATLYNQSLQQSAGRQSDAEKLAEMQQVLRMKQRQLAEVQAQRQAYYAAASSNNSSRTSSQSAPTTIEANSHQRTSAAQALAGGLKRESPLDLSVKTVRQSADSTAKDDSESAYHANYQAHEAFQHRSKQPIKSQSPRNSAVLPPLQLPSTVVYPHFDNHSTSQAGSSGAPKVDFLPNFNAHHSSSGSSSANFHDANKRQRKSSTSQLPSPSQYPSHMGSLPHMGSFKKNSLSSAAYDDPNKQSQYYPATGPPSLQRSSALTNHSSLNMQPTFPVAPSSQYPYDSTKRGSSARYDYLDRRSSTSSLQSSSSAESNYSLGKRQPSSELRHSLPPKIPRVVDTWRQTIDQQIEQRLNSYASSRAHQINGTTKESSLSNDSVLHQQVMQPFTSVPSSNIQTSHSSSTQQSSNSLVNRSSLYTSHRSDSSSKLNVTNQYYPHSQPQYPAHNVPPRPTQETYNNLAQVKLPSLPSNGAADKRVLSILRKRLDTREATNQLVQQQLQLQQQQQQQQQPQLAHHQDRSKIYTSLGSRPYSQQLVVPSPVISSHSKPPSQNPLGRHNLPPFNALNLERNAAMAYPTQKLHIPKAMDSVVPEHSNPAARIDHQAVPRSPLPVRAEASGKPPGGENGGDFDGLAAFLAARIRTKAELKQVGPTMEQQQRTSTPASGSNSSAHSPRTTPGIFSPPPSAQMPYPAVPSDFGKGTPQSDSDRASSSGLSSSSPLKPSRDRYGINSPRRRLFCRPDDEPGGVTEGVIQAREVGLRSSSETSVFDFRESDSDGETASERQSLHEMRKDRDRRLQEKHQNIASFKPASDTPEVDDTEPIDDEFWSGMCDQFVNQLQKGGNKIRKRGRRKKIVPVPIEPEPLELIDQYDEDRSEASSSIALPLQIENIKVEEEDNENLSKLPVEEIKETTTSEEHTMMLKENIKKEEESSDEDAPLSLRQTELKKVKETCIKQDHSVIEETNLEKCADNEKPGSKIEIKKEDVKNEIVNQDLKKELTDSENESSADESIESVAKRLRMRKPKEEVSKRKTRSSEKENLTTPPKVGRKKKEVKKKSVYGDGSEFRPGWEAEVYRYKRSLRMPARLINIAGPQSWPRLSVSLPDLDPDSPMTLDSEISLQNKRFESDGEATPTKVKHTDSVKGKHSQKKAEEKVEEDSFINRLIQRYGGKGKKSLRKGQEKDSSKERKGPKIIPQTTELQLLPTPSIDSIVKSPVKKHDQNSAQNKHVKGKKTKNAEQPIDYESPEAVYLGYFRKKTVADFRDAFARHNGGFATEHELPPIMLKSRTRTQTRILTQRATIREVFGEDRPASAPPAGCRSEDGEEHKETFSDDKKLNKKSKKCKAIIGRRNSNNSMSVGTRSGLRSAAVLRSNKAVLKSKRQLLHGGERRKRSKDLIKAYSTGKKYQDGKHGTLMEAVIKLEPVKIIENVEEESPVLVNEKRLRYRNVRRKLKSSGFDYIRKKKKQQQKKEGDNESAKEKKKTTPTKPFLESEDDIQNEIKGWVINKGLGETVLHRAARLGYTDIAAYCLEKMDHNPSPRDNAGYTPLHEACSKGRLDIARLLLLYGADVSDSAQGGIRPLHEAVENGCLELIRLLLSYGADPLLATYSGLTPLSLTHNSPDAKALLQAHLADVQGQSASPWQVPSIDWSMSGCDPLADPPSLDPSDGEVEVESAELSLPHLYQLLGEPLADRWVLFQELGPVLRVKTREALIKQLGQSHRNDFRDLKMTDFYDMARCCSILGVGDYILNPKAHKVTLVKYSERVRALLNSEKLMVTAR